MKKFSKGLIMLFIVIAVIIIAAVLIVAALRKDNSDVLQVVDEKPVIYLYPTDKTDVTVTLGRPEDITCSYPKYSEGWRVTASPDGSLTDRLTGKSLYALYYESKIRSEFPVTNEGFVVRGSDSAGFLDEKLSILGLTPREAEEFIIYWLPRLEASEYNYIRFADADEIEGNMPLTIEPAPNTVLRVIMVFKALDKPLDVTEQKLTPALRQGFTAVEWGGVEK